MDVKFLAGENIKDCVNPLGIVVLFDVVCHDVIPPKNYIVWCLPLHTTIIPHYEQSYNVLILTYFKILYDVNYNTIKVKDYLYSYLIPYSCKFYF